LIWSAFASDFSGDSLKMPRLKKLTRPSSFSRFDERKTS
jgi:hypothetical protein